MPQAAVKAVVACPHFIQEGEGIPRIDDPAAPFTQVKARLCALYQYSHNSPQRGKVTCFKLVSTKLKALINKD
jgi:hypothetical protein